MTTASEPDSGGVAPAGGSPAVTPPAAAGTSPTTAGAKGDKAAPQAGILNRPPEHLLLAAVTLNGSDPRSTVEAIRTIVRAELTSALAPVGDPSQPAETGELGFADHYDRAHLTITVGFSASGYDKLGVAQADRPADLIAMPWDKLGETPDDPASGDLVLQICADNAYITEHVVRRLEHSLGSAVQINWAHTGVQRYNSRPGRTARREGRAWIGFLDGTSNLRPSKDDRDSALTLRSARPVRPIERAPVPAGLARTSRKRARLDTKRHLPRRANQHQRPAELGRRTAGYPRAGDRPPEARRREPRPHRPSRRHRRDPACVQSKPGRRARHRRRPHPQGQPANG
jgi:hypothetical protein